MLVFSTATIFMAVVSESGGVDYVVRATIKYFYNRRVVALLILMVIVLIPGAFTGAGSVSLLVVGAPVAAALRYLGVCVEPQNGGHFVYRRRPERGRASREHLGDDALARERPFPYVGFELPRWVSRRSAGAFTVLFLGWKKEGSMTLETALREMPEPPARMAVWRVVLPFLVFFVFIAAYRIWPFATPVIGLALEFAVVALVAWAVSPVRLNLLRISRDTVKRLLPLLSTVVVVGMLQQVMTATGVRGLISFAVLSTPLVLLIVLLALIIPVSEGILTYGAAAIIGIPLIWFLDSIGYHATIVIAALSLIWPLGDGLPPTALIGRLSVMVSGYRESYWTFLKSTWIPWLVITAVGLLMIVYSTKLAFLVAWSL